MHYCINNDCKFVYLCNLREIKLLSYLILNTILELLNLTVNMKLYGRVVRAILTTVLM